MRTNHYWSRREGGGEVKKEGFGGRQQSVKGENFYGPNTGFKSVKYFIIMYILLYHLEGGI